jgi:hypothetical protein
VLGRGDRGNLRKVSGFVALIWLVNFVSCAATEGMVPATIADITSATDQVGEASFVGSIFIVAAYGVLGAAALGFYGAMWFSWVRNLPPSPEQDGGSEQGRAVAVHMAVGAELRVFFHLALVLFATGNFEPLGWVGIATQAMAVASMVMAMIVLHRASRIAGPPHGDIWIVVGLLFALLAATEGWVIARL